MNKKKIGIIIGSLRKDSYSRIIANWAIEHAPENLELHIIEIGNLPMYNQDFDEDYPKEYIAFKDALKAMDGYLFVTPEHNRSMPAALKNALDVASRPWGKSVWAGKPGAVISLSTGAIGGFGATHHLRQSMAFLDVAMMQQPECYLGDIAECVNDKGELFSERTTKFLKSFLKSYANWVAKMSL